MSDNDIHFSIRLRGEHIEMIKGLQERYGMNSWASVLKYALEKEWTNTKGMSEATDKAKVLNAKIIERMTGDILGSFKKQRDKIAAIDEAYENGDITADIAKQMKSTVDYNYKNSREAMLREYAKATEPQKPDLASIISKRLQEKAPEKIEENYDPYADPNAYVFKHCGFEWNAKNSTSKCPLCGKMIQGKPKA